MTEPFAGAQSDLDAVSLGEPAPAPEVTSLDPVEPYRRWANVLFMILALIGILGAVVALNASPEPVVFWQLLVSIVLFVMTLLVVVAAIRDPASWAVHAIAPICYVIIAGAVIRAVVALSQNTITVPLEGIGALMVLTRDHRPERLPPLTQEGRRRVWMAVGAILLAQVLPYVSGSIAGRAPFGVQAESLDLQVAADCKGVGEPGGEIPVRAAWSWRAREVFSPQIDGLVVLWTMTTSDGGDTSAGGVVDDPVIMSHPAMWAGSGHPASALTQPLTQEFPSREFGIDIGEAGLIDGSVELALRPADPTARHGDLAAWAAYAHGDRWLRQSETTTCSW